MIITEDIKDVVPIYDILKQAYLMLNSEFPPTLNESSRICEKISNNI
ncbi:MAG: hypothetical protein ACUZ9M_04985 [Candidatus Scalindua sp.]